MKNHIAFKSQYLTPHEFVLSSEYISGLIDTSSSASTTLKLNQQYAEFIVEHTDDATLQSEFVNNIKKALIAKPGVGKVPVQLPEGFEVTFVDFG